MNTFEENAARIAGSMGAAARRVAAPPPVMIGEVLSAEPLRVRADGLDLEPESLRVNEALLRGYQPKLVGMLISILPPNEVTTEVKKENLSRAEPALKPGDQVAVFSTDQQTYYILCKVVAV